VRQECQSAAERTLNAARPGRLTSPGRVISRICTNADRVHPADGRQGPRLPARSERDFCLNSVPMLRHWLGSGPPGIAKMVGVRIVRLQVSLSRVV